MPKKTFTHILATLGPSSSDEDTISRLIDAGADAFRFNFSHGSHKDHKKRYDVVRQLAKQKETHIGIVADLQGPKLRIGEFKDKKILLKEGDVFTLDMKKELGTQSRVTLPHTEIFAAIKVGDELLLNDGNIALTITECGDNSATTLVKIGGELSGHKGVNLPNIKLPISSLTEKDLEDLKFALKLGVDWVCLSFVQTAEDVRYARSLIGKKALIVSKLEKPSAIDELEDIIKLSDAIMVARGDLGVECPLQTVPVLQKRIVAACRKYARPVIVATQMLESMIEKPTPTRAEVSDVATAVYDGVDTVMLSAETAAGKYPIEAVTMMGKIIEQVEADPLYSSYMHSSSQHKSCCFDESDAITFAASKISTTLENVSAIITYTSSGKTTYLTARERATIPIIAITSDPKVAQQLSIVWGARRVVNKTTFKSMLKIEDIAKKVALESGTSHHGDHLIITAGFPLGISGRTNILHTVYIA